MALGLENLDDSTREYMLAEIDHDERADRLYISPRLSPQGAEAYPRLLKYAAQNGDDDTLAVALAEPDMLNARESYERAGKLLTRKMNSRAPQTLAEGEFNRFFIRGLCAGLCADGGGPVEVYRARASSWVRPESEALIGASIGASELLEDLREHVGEAPSLLPYVNSGLSVRLP